MFCVELAKPEGPVQWLWNQKAVVAGGRVAVTAGRLRSFACQVRAVRAPVGRRGPRPCPLCTGPCSDFSPAAGSAVCCRLPRL